MSFHKISAPILKGLLVTGIALAISGCSVNLTRGNLDNVPKTTEKFSFFGSIPLVLGDQSVELSQDLLKAYTAAASAEAFPRERCRGNAAVQASVQRNDSGSAWYLGAMIPFWPVMPVDETWTYKLTARIFCDGTLVKHVEFTEQEQVKATLYGRLRSDLVNSASDEMHRKLVQRLAYELSDRPADQNSVSDY